MSAKPRSDSRLKSLPPHYKQALIRWLVDENMSYTEAKERLRKEFSVSTSEGALSSFYATECYSLRSSEALSFAEEIAEQLKDGPDKFDQATLALVKQKCFERAYAKNGSIDELAVLAKIIGDSAKLQLKEQEIALAKGTLELKVKQYEDKMISLRSSLEKAKNRGGVSKETLQLIEEQLKLL